jgi:hypothetical protein
VAGGVRRPRLRLRRRGPAAARLSNAHLDRKPNPDTDVYSNAEANRHSDLNTHPNADANRDAEPNTHPNADADPLLGPETIYARGAGNGLRDAGQDARLHRRA